jgi:hypothetical protein
MFLHMKAGLDADPIRLPFSYEAYQEDRTVLSASGIRKEFQKALAELRTDLDAFTTDESYGLMACGYQMATKSFQRDLASLVELWDSPREFDWVFRPMLAEITSTAASTPNRNRLLQTFRAGSSITL